MRALGRADTTDLASLLVRLNRALRAAARAGPDEEVLLPAQAELVRLVHREPGLRVNDAARRLGIAPNTASTLVGRLVDLELIVRERDPRDGRVARLQLTPRAVERIARVRDRRQVELARALANLALDDQRVLTTAAPSLHRLLKALEGRPADDESA